MLPIIPQVGVSGRGWGFSRRLFTGDFPRLFLPFSPLLTFSPWRRRDLCVLMSASWHTRTPTEGNPIVFFDVSMGGQPLGRVKMELFADVAPRTCENFRQFCTGDHRDRHTKQPIGYKGCSFHRCIKGFMLQGGDFVKGDGTGCVSIYGSSFADETFVGKHTGAGLLSMANSGPNSNGCQFFITCAPCEWLDGKHVVFGRVVGDGMLTVRRMESVPTGAGNRPNASLHITECGEM